jgi:UrcA family protein
MLNKMAFGSMLLAMLVGASAAAMAQQNSSTTERITVVAPYIAQRLSTPDAKGAVFSVLSNTSTVSYADLNLAKPSDDAVFKKRVSDTAKDLCTQLQTRYPQTMYEPVVSADCVKTATNEAMQTVNLLIDIYTNPPSVH